MDIQTLHWLAGLLEGEGSFMRGVPSAPNAIRIAVQMTDKDIVDRIGDIFGTKVYFDKSKNPKWKDTYHATVTGRRACKLMQELYPLMGIRRKEQIENALRDYPYIDTEPTKNRYQERRMTSAQVIDYRVRWGEGENAKKMAMEAGIWYTSFYRMLNRQTYKDV